MHDIGGLKVIVSFFDCNCNDVILKKKQFVRMLPADILTSSACPLEGRYVIHTGSLSCDSYFRSGCNGSSVIDIISTCASRPGIQRVCVISIALALCMTLTIISFKYNV